MKRAHGADALHWAVQFRERAATAPLSTVHPMSTPPDYYQRVRRRAPARIFLPHEPIRPLWFRVGELALLMVVPAAAGTLLFIRARRRAARAARSAVSTMASPVATAGAPSAATAGRQGADAASAGAGGVVLPAGTVGMEHAHAPAASASAAAAAAHELR
jgi:hypothetical protein